MGIKLHFLKHVVTAFAAGAVFVVCAHAQDAEAALLEQLRAAPQAEAQRLDRELALMWDNSGSPAMNLLLQRGRDALEAQDVTAAIDHLTALTDHAPQFAEGWHARATAYYRAGLYGPAMDDLERALALNPNNYNALFGLGVMFGDVGDTRRANAAFQQVLDINPHHKNAKTAVETLMRDGLGRTL